MELRYSQTFLIISFHDLDFSLKKKKKKTKGNTGIQLWPRSS